MTSKLHSLRHTHASRLIASGLDVLAISRRLGHGSPTITLGGERGLYSVGGAVVHIGEKMTIDGR